MKKNAVAVCASKGLADEVAIVYRKSFQKSFLP